MKKRTDTPKTRRGTIPIVFLPSRSRWQLTIHREGKRTRTFHETEADAEKAWKAHKRHLERFGSDAGEYSPEQHQEYVRAKKIVREVDLAEVAAFYRLHHPEGARSVTISEAVAGFLEQQSGKGLAVRYLANLRAHCERFELSFGPRAARSVTGNDVLSWLNGLKLDPRTVRNYSASIATLFNWCQRRGIVTLSPTASLHDSDLPQARPKAKGVLSVDQCAAMMAWVDKNAPKHAPFHALQLFAGIRRAEVGRLKWEWLDLERETITLPGWSEGERVVKTGDDWVLHDLPANLWEWLRKHGKESGRVAVPGSQTVIKWRDEFAKLEPPIATWPKNAMRHTFCTMMMSLHGDAAKVATWSRHTNAATLWKSYVAKLVSREDAERFCSIKPL